MFPRQFRLRKEWEIKKVFKKGQCLYSPLFSLFFFQNNKQNTQVKVIVSKKYDKQAVQRNRLRRKFQEAAHFSILNLKKSLNIIILPKNKTRNVNFLEIKKEIESIFGKIN